MHKAHDQSAMRDNVSSVTVQNVSLGSGNYLNAICAAILSTGGKHAPIIPTIELLEGTGQTEAVERMLAIGAKVPGWGNSFVQDDIDPIWKGVDAKLKENHGPIHDVMGTITRVLHANNVMIYPNPSAYTAACAIVLGIPKHAAPYLFVACRLERWSYIFKEHGQ